MRRGSGSGATHRAYRTGRLPTPTGRGEFSVARYSTDGLVLPLGKKEAWTPLPWRALEDVPDLLRGQGWVQIGSVYSTASTDGTLDAYLKRFLSEPLQAGWLSVLDLERAEVLAIDRSPPAKVQLRSSGW
jgi:hypothetical protein